jgi:hypothetical protein
LKYRCPAAAYGLNCEGKAECHCLGGVSPGEYGRIARINITKENRRIFVPTPLDSPSWGRCYNRRNSLGWINNRLDNNFCFEKHYIRGKAKMKIRMELSLVVIMAMALGHILVILRRVEKLRFVRWSSRCQRRPDRESQKYFMETELKRFRRENYFQ